MDEYSSFYRLCFDFHKKHAPFPQTLESFCDAMTEAAGICAQNGGNAFLTDLLSAVTNELERQYKQHHA